MSLSFSFYVKGNVCVDTGAQYIHGSSEKNPVYCLLKNSGLLNQVPEMGEEAFYSNKGHKVDSNIARRAYEAGEGIIQYRGSNTGKSLGEHYAEKTQSVIDILQDNDNQMKTRMRSILALVGKDMLIDVGASDLHRVSLDSWQYYINMGDNLNVAGYDVLRRWPIFIAIIAQWMIHLVLNVVYVCQFNVSACGYAAGGLP